MNTELHFDHLMDLQEPSVHIGCIWPICWIYVYLLMYVAISDMQLSQILYLSNGIKCVYISIWIYAIINILYSL